MKKLLFLCIISFFSIFNIFSDVFLSESDFDFGSVKNGTIIEGSFFVTADTQTSISVSTSCECLSVDNNFVTLDVDFPQEIRFTFDTTDYANQTEKNIIINTENQEQIYFVIKGFVVSNQKDNENNDDFLYQTDKSLLQNDVLGYFSYKNCKKCANLAKQINAFSNKNNLKMYFYNLEEQDNKKNIYEITQEIGKYPSLPFVILNEKYFFGEKEITNLITNQSESNQHSITRNKNNINIFAIILSGLLDGINPCAFTVIILLISYLSLQLKNRKSILFTGMIYTASVFVTYFLVGLGLFEFLKKLATYSIIATILRYFITIFLIILAILSFIDFILIKTGKKNEMLLKLPKFLQNKIRKNIREQTHNYKIFTTALTLGVLVSIFELACTGQVYFPIIGYMVNSTDQRTLGLFLLLIYNIGFIIPLLAVFILVYTGVSSKKLGDFFGKNVAVVKLLFCFLFILFAIINII